MSVNRRSILEYSMHMKYKRRVADENSYYRWVLGGGKTTVLNHLLAESLKESLKPAVIMNEFGKMSVDGALVSEHTFSELTEGYLLRNESRCIRTVTSIIFKKSNQTLYLLNVVGLQNRSLS